MTLGPPSPVCASCWGGSPGGFSLGEQPLGGAGHGNEITPFGLTMTVNSRHSYWSFLPGRSISKVRRVSLRPEMEGFARLLQRAGKAAGLTIRVHPHMLRHACGYKLANDGVDTRALQSYLGHKNIQHTVRYTEMAPGRFKGFWKD
jgi:hypothetical protein